MIRLRSWNLWVDSGEQVGVDRSEIGSGQKKEAKYESVDVRIRRGPFECARWWMVKMGWCRKKPKGRDSIFRRRFGG